MVKLCDEFVPAWDVIFERARSLRNGVRGWLMEDALEPTTPVSRSAEERQFKLTLLTGSPCRRPLQAEMKRELFPRPSLRRQKQTHAT